MTQPISALRDLHRGRTVTILGRGPSLLELHEVPFGPVIALNQSILYLRRLAASGPVYTMQKDACLVEPLPSEALIVSKLESPRCYRNFPRRYIFNPVADFGIKGSHMSSPVALRIALLMGAESIVMLCHDAYTQADGRFVEPSGALTAGFFDSYREAGEDCNLIAIEAGVPIEWVTPGG